GLRFTAATGNEQGDQQAEDDGAHDRDDKAQIAFRFLLRGAATARWLVAIVHESGGILVHTYYLYAVGTRDPSVDVTRTLVLGAENRVEDRPRVGDGAPVAQSILDLGAGRAGNGHLGRQQARPGGAAVAERDLFGRVARRSGRGGVLDRRCIVRSAVVPGAKATGDAVAEGRAHRFGLLVDATDHGQRRAGRPARLGGRVARGAGGG